MNINTLNILADSVSDVGSWIWWNTEKDPGLFLLGEAVEGAEQVCNLSGMIHVETVE